MCVCVFDIEGKKQGQSERTQAGHRDKGTSSASTPRFFFLLTVPFLLLGGWRLKKHL